MTSERAFIEFIGRLAHEDMKASGILASITIAQACLESGYGTTDLAIKANNLFGMKTELSGRNWKSVWDGKSSYEKVTLEQTDEGHEYAVKALFRRYHSVKESVMDHSLYLIGAKKGDSNRYPGISGCRDYRDAAQIIKNGGYATDVRYVRKLCDLIETFGLTKYDLEGENKMKIYISPSDQTGNKYNAGNTNEHTICQKIAEYAAKALKRNGYDVKVGKEGSTYRERVGESNAWGADVHLPIHTNAGGGDGTVVFAHPASVNNKYVKRVYEYVANLSPGKDDGIRAMNNLYEINNTRNVCVYLECEFHDNTQLAKWIINNVDEIGEAIAKGFCAADGKKYKKREDGANAPAADGKTYKVQVGSFSIKANAEALMKKLKADGYDAFIKTE